MGSALTDKLDDAFAAVKDQVRVAEAEIGRKILKELDAAGLGRYVRIAIDDTDRMLDAPRPSKSRAKSRKSRAKSRPETRARTPAELAYSERQAAVRKWRLEQVAEIIKIDRRSPDRARATRDFIGSELTMPDGTRISAITYGAILFGGYGYLIYRDIVRS